MEPQVLEKIRSLPDGPGIYLFLSAERKPLYVGKAKSLKKRVQAYLRPELDPRLQAMVAEACDLDIVVTDSEAEALLLENTWIKRHQPRYNIRLRDDKTYPYLKLTLDQTYPRLAFTRRVRDDGSEYYGPYLPAGLARKAIKLVQKLFQVRICRIEIDGRLPRPCLYYDMNRCLGPCVDGLTDRERYQEAIESSRLFLSGRTDELTKRLQQEMHKASDELEYERAAHYRDLLSEVDLVTQRRKLSSAAGEDVDIYGVHVEGGNAAVVILVMRSGQVLDRRELFWEGAGAIPPQQLLSELLPQVYDHTPFIPKELHLPLPVEGEEVLTEWLTGRKGERVYLRKPARGPKAERVGLAMRNAKLAHRRRFRVKELADGAERLRQLFELDEPPRRIEGFDISTLHGSETVASLVVWEEGAMRKSEYRSFNIRGLTGADDFESLRQAVERRYRRRLDEVGEMPDLILIDGGRGQLNAALHAMACLGVEETPVVGLAKGEEELYTPGSPTPRRLPRRDPGLMLLQRIRDEAHRFAVSRHRRRRSRRTLHSQLDELHGVGPLRRRRLIEHFGSFDGVQRAPREDLVAVLGPVLGAKVYDQIHSAGET